LELTVYSRDVIYCEIFFDREIFSVPSIIFVIEDPKNTTKIENK
jgi:hypothetical protein